MQDAGASISGYSYAKAAVDPCLSLADLERLDRFAKVNRLEDPVNPLLGRTARLCCRFALTLLLGNACHSVSLAQAGPAIQAAPDGIGYTLHVTTREVIVEVVARDPKNHPVNNLAQGEFEIYEGRHRSTEGLKTISGFRTIDPSLENSHTDDRLRSVVLPLGGRCEIRTTVHYELAFRPGNWTSGYHSIVVTTTRHHVTLSYRAQYYIGVSDIAASPTRREPKDIRSDLSSAACYHPGIPASLSLSAKKIETEELSQLHYSVRVLPGSLQLAGVEQHSDHVQLEYGVCTFSRSGSLLGYWHFSENRSISPADISTVLSDGWLESVVIPRKGNPALARFVVLEPKTGNLGTIDLSTDAHILSDQPEDSDPEESTHVLVAAENVGTARRTASLGSPVPRPGALCGDVYELPTATKLLPADFQSLNAVGAVYTNSLNVREQMLELGIPGSTQRSEWFGIDYYGQFWVTRPGKYLFFLNADDGADLYIDEHKVIGDDGIHPPQTVSGSITLDAGRHTIHLPYFEGPKYVNLILQVKAPDGELKLFDVRDFPDPSQHAASSR